MLPAPLDLASGEVAVPAVHRLELAAIDRDDCVREDLHVPAEADEPAAHRGDRAAVVLAEVGDGLEVRRQPASQPDQFQVPLCLPLQTAAGLDAVEVTVDVDLEQRRGVIRRTTASHAIGGLEAQSAQIQCFHEGINHPHRVVIVDEVFQPIREQKSLGTINTIHESLHAEHPLAGAQIMPVEAGFSHSLGRKQTCPAISG